MQTKRKLTTYEINLLIEKGFDPFSIKLDSLKDQPIEYFLKEAEFFGRKFYVDQKVLIPRIETEELINLALKYVQENKLGKVSFIDMGTGSGVIGITFALELLKRNKEASGILSDISAEALAVAKQNKENLASDLDLSLKQSDLFNEIPKDLKFDIVFANLPYIPTNRIEKLSKSVKDYEPRLALDGGSEGFDLVEKLLNDLKLHLKKPGIAILEVDDTHNEEFLSRYWEKESFDIKIMNDQNDKNRYWLVTFAT